MLAFPPAIIQFALIFRFAIWSGKMPGTKRQRGAVEHRQRTEMDIVAVLPEFRCWAESCLCTLGGGVCVCIRRCRGPKKAPLSCPLSFYCHLVDDVRFCVVCMRGSCESVCVCVYVCVYVCECLYTCAWFYDGDYAQHPPLKVSNVHINIHAHTQHDEPNVCIWNFLVPHITHLTIDARVFATVIACYTIREK